MSIETANRRPQRADVRERVLRAAGELFVRQGYGPTTVDQVAAAAGFTKGAVYSNFGGKPGLFAAAVAEQLAGRTSEAVATAAALGGQRSSRLAAELTALVASDSWSMLMNEFRTVASRDAAVAQVYADLRRRTQADLADRLRAIAPDLGLAPDHDLEASAALLITVVSALAQEHAIAPTATPLPLVERAMAALLTGILP